MAAKPAPKPPAAKTPTSLVIDGVTVPYKSGQALLKGADAQWTTEDADYRHQLANYQADINLQRNNATTDMSQSMQRLGFKGAVANQSALKLDPNTGATITPAATTWKGGAWDNQDQTTAMGRSYRGITNDVSARGIVNSSDTAHLINNNQLGYNDQLSAMTTANQNFNNDLTGQAHAYASENLASRASALQQALARQAAKQSNLITPGL